MRPKDDKHRLPKPLVFGILFAGSFMPGAWGKVFAALAGLVLALCILELFTGRKRCILALFLPIAACIAVRFVSYGAYRCMADDSFRDAAASRTAVALGYAGIVLGTVVHYVLRCWEAFWSCKEAFQTFYRTHEFASLEPVGKHIQFLTIMLAMVVCMVHAFRDRQRS